MEHSMSVDSGNLNNNDNGSAIPCSDSDDNNDAGTGLCRLDISRDIFEDDDDAEGCEELLKEWRRMANYLLLHEIP